MPSPPAPAPTTPASSDPAAPPTTDRTGREIDITIPTTREMVDGVRDLNEWHPRDPEIRVRGRHHGAGPPDPEGASADDRNDGGSSSGLATAAMLAGMAGGAALNLIDIVRVGAKYPEALRAGRFDPALGRLGRLPTALSLTAQMRVDSRIVDPLAPPVASVASLGRSFTRFDKFAMRSSVLLGASLAAIQIGTAIPNIVDAVSKDGPWYENLLRSTSGRFGVLQLGGGVLGASLFATALHQTARQGGQGAVARILAAGNATIMAKPLWGRIGIGSGVLVAANALGYLDMLNKGEDRSIGQVLTDASRSTPVLNDPKLRTATLLAAGGVTAFKAHRSIAAAGTGIAALPKGYWAAGAAVAGLLGAQFLGGLNALNKG